MSEMIGPVILDLIGTELNVEERDLLTHPLVGGVILFTRNYSTPHELAKLCQEIRAVRKTPLLIVVDQEGGRVQRFCKEFTRLPSMGFIGRVYEHSKQNALKFAELCGWLMATEILACGMDLSFAPVLDLNKMKNEAVGDRAFHHEPIKVIDLAKALMRGMNTAGMVATGKHFPGHGSVAMDSHLDTPIDTRTFEEIATDDLLPFQELIYSGLSAMMPAHIIFPKADQNPVGFSSYWLQDVLRKRCCFTGTIFSDDLNMKGAAFAGEHAERAHKALMAGCDMILICNNRIGAIKILDHLPHKYFVNEEKFKKLQGKFSQSFEQMKISREWRENQSSFMRCIDSFQEFVL